MVTLDNKSVASLFDELAKLMELEGENPFKIRSYQSAYQQIRNLNGPLLEMSPDEISSIKGIGKAIAQKIEEIKDTGTFSALENMRRNIPSGVQEMLKIKGLGVKKIKTLWKDYHIDTIESLQDAAHNNQLVEVKGISAKTQQQIIEKISLYMDSQGKLLNAQAQLLADDFMSNVLAEFPGYKIQTTGQIRRYEPIVERVELITDIPGQKLVKHLNKSFGIGDVRLEDNSLFFYGAFSCVIYLTDASGFEQRRFESVLSPNMLSWVEETFDKKIMKDEQQWFLDNKLMYLPPELRDRRENWRKMGESHSPEWVQEKDIRGLIHFHTTYSDGMNTLDEMISAARDKGFEYAVVSDHSKSAFYASGLNVDRVIQQWNEIERVQKNFPNIKIYRSIESDILNDGSLDYEEDILKQFDLIIASIHSNLNMDEDKAMKRLIRAIENPYTRILGHMTGRLLLMRHGYPVDHPKVIDACAANGVAIELNANPRRMDVDWQWIGYAMDKGVLIGIHPDAHNVEGMDDIRWGIRTARKGGLIKQACLNAKTRNEFEEWLKLK